MQEFSIGAGLASLAFWGFIATVVVAGIWSEIRKRESQQETMRRMVESSGTIDQELLDKLLSVNNADKEDHEKNFKVTALWILPVSLGLAALGLVLGIEVPKARMPLLAVSSLTACLGIGFWVASLVIIKLYPNNDTKTNK